MRAFGARLAVNGDTFVSSYGEAGVLYGLRYYREAGEFVATVGSLRHRWPAVAADVAEFGRAIVAKLAEDEP